MSKSENKKKSEKSIINKFKKIGKDLIYSYEEPSNKKKTNYKTNYKTIDYTPREDITKNIITSFILGLVVGLVVMSFFIPERISTLDNGEQIIVDIGDKNITANELYNNMKKDYSISILIDHIDNIILSSIYPEDNEMKTSVNETADYYISMYETYYEYSEEQFLATNGFSSRDEFIEQLKLDYRRNKYYRNYLENLITDVEINNYYENNVFGDISTKYISVEFSDNQETSKELIIEIINKLNSGSTYEEIIKEYKGRIKYEDLGYISFDNKLDDTYIRILKKLKNDSYTKDAVKDENAYKIIFKGDQLEKVLLEDIRDTIIKKIADQKNEEDKTLYYKSLDKLRKENQVQIKDTELAKKYDKYIKEVTTIK